MTWDASQHALWGWMVWSDVATGNWLTFLYDSYRQVYWPPFHSWALAAAMLVLGPSPYVTGLVSLVAYAVAGVALGVLAKRAAPDHGEIAAGVTVGLWLTAGTVVIRYATDAYTEMLAVAVTALALLQLSRAFALGTRSAWAWAGAGAAITYLTKTDYGIILILATAGGTLLAARAGSQTEPLRKLAPWAVVIAVVAAVWFAFPPKILTTVSALLNREQGPPTLSVAGLAYHFVSLVTWTDGILLWGMGFLALGLTVARPRTDLLRVIPLYVGVAFLLHTLSETKDAKHIVKVLPWLFLLVGVQVARARAAAETTRRGNLLLGAMAIALVAVAVVRIGDFLEKAQPPVQTGTDRIARAIAARIRPDASHVVIGTFVGVSPHYLNWTVLGDDPYAWVVPDPMTKTGYTREAFQERMAALRGRAPLLGVLERGRPGPTYRIAHLLPRRRHEPTDVAAIVERLFRHAPDRVFVLVLAPGSRWDTEDYRQFNHPGAAFLPHLRARPDLEVTEVLEFPGQGVQLIVFDRRLLRAAKDGRWGR